MKKADLALYRVKSSGRGSYEVYRPDCALTNGVEELEAAFEAAVHEEKLELNYQPIVDINTREITGCEALMRWRHPSLGMVPPSTFIPIAEKSGLIVRAGNWALRKACSDAAHWPAHVKVTVNLSAVQFEIGDPYEAISNALFESDLAPERLEIEITESALLREEERTKETLARIRALGVKVVLDDFGTAFASLSYLQKFRFDKIKIDRSFVRDISERRDCAAIVNAVTGLARALEIGTVAEGIETADQLAHVSNIGCREVQGYFFSRPVPAEDIDAAFSRCYEQLSASAKPGATEPQGGPECPLPPCAA